jgi:hypothetical protein
MLSYYDTGELLERAAYRAGQLDGSWTRYRQDGRVEERRTYREGLLVERVEYDARGKARRRQGAAVELSLLKRLVARRFARKQRMR